MSLKMPFEMVDLSLLSLDCNDMLYLRTTGVLQPWRLSLAKEKPPCRVDGNDSPNWIQTLIET